MTYDQRPGVSAEFFKGLIIGLALSVMIWIAIFVRLVLR